MTEPSPVSTRPLLTVLFLGVLMGALDIAIVGPALPELRQAFAADGRSLAWIFSVYVLANITGAPLLGKLSDTLGRRKLYLACVAIFALGSLLVALAPDFYVLLAGRALQGFGAGGIFPVASATIGDVFPPERRGRALGLIGAVFGIAFLIGPLLGAALLPFGWRLLFLINIPLALGLMVAARRLLPDRRGPGLADFDVPGVVLLSSGLLLVALALTHMEPKALFQSLTSANVLPLGSAGILLLLIFLWQESRAVKPVLRLDVFRNRTLVIAGLLAFGAGVTEALFVFIPPFLVEAFSIASAKASLWLAIPVLALTVGAPVSGRLLDKLGGRIVILAGTGLLACGLFLMGRFPPTFPLYVASAILLGLGIAALVGAPVRYLVLNEARPDEKASLQSAISLLTNMGMLMGGVSVGAVVASAPRGETGYQLAFLAASAFAALLFLATLFLRKSPSRSEPRAAFSTLDGSPNGAEPTPANGRKG